jgi:hypothetical protein
LRNGDRINAPFAFLRDYFAERDISVQTADYMPKEESSTQNVYICMGSFKDYRRVARRSDTILSSFFVLECPNVDPDMYRELARAQKFFRHIFTWSDAPSLEYFIKPLRCEHFCWPQSFDDVHEEIWHRTDREFLVMINSNRLPLVYRNDLYAERLRALDFFSRTGDIHLYGNGWNEPPFPMHRRWVPYTLRFMHHAFNKRWQQFRPNPLLEAARSVYKGRAASKSDTLGKYTFALCFENSILKGWITEKIFDCFFAGTIPVYWGAPNITEWVPPSCFIDMRKFSGYPELMEFLRSLTDKDIRTYKQAARDFLLSPRFRPFSKLAFAELVARIVEQDTGIKVSSEKYETATALA